MNPGFIVNDGNGGNNYAVNLVSNNNGVIIPASLTVTAASSEKLYDGTVATIGHTHHHIRQQGGGRHASLYGNL